MSKITRRGFLRQLLLGGCHGLLRPRAKTLTNPSRPRNPVIVFVGDGMRQDLTKQLVSEGKMPNYQRLLATGVDAGKGLIPVLPANSVPNWATMATGTSPSVHGATNNLFHDNRRQFTHTGLIGFMPWNHKGESIAERAEASGLTVVVLTWKTFEIRSLNSGAAIGVFPTFLTGRGIIANYDVPSVRPDVLEAARQFGGEIAYRQVALTPAAGWVNVPATFSPAQEATLEVVEIGLLPGLPPPDPTVLTYYLYFYDSTDDRMVNYDTVLISPTKDGADRVAVLTAGQWSGSIPATVKRGHGKFYVKVLNLEPDLSMFRLYYTAVTRVQARPQSLADDLTARFDAITRWDDFYPFWAGLIDADTWTEQTLRWNQVLGGQMFPYVVKTYQPDLVMAGTPVPDIIQHAFLAQAMPGAEAYDPFRASSAREFVERSYIEADRMLGGLWALMPSANILAISDHGFSATTQIISSHDLLTAAGLYDGENLPGSQAVPYETSGSVQIYINLEGRNPTGVVPTEEYESVRQQIAELLEGLGPNKIERVLLKEQTGGIPTTIGVTMNMLHPDRTGDVVAFAVPPYHFGHRLLGEFLLGDHGFIPNGDEERFAAFAAGGPDIAPGRVVGPVTAQDVVPTVASALGIEPPPAAEGRVLPIFRAYSVFMPLIMR